MTRRSLPDEEYERLHRNRALIRKVPCPKCAAPAGGPFRSVPGGSNLYVDHQERRHAAAEAGVYVP